MQTPYEPEPTIAEPAAPVEYIELDGAALEPAEPSKVPTQKVTSALAAGSLATVVVILVTALTHTNAPAGLEGALATLFAFLGGYIAPRD